MRVAVISDTHMSAPTPWLERVYASHLAPADALVHCGDMTGRATWSFFLQHPDFHCVAGNMDDWDLAADLPARLDRELGGLRVAVCHGWGFKVGLSRRLYDAFGPDYGVIFFGHTHVREDTRYGATRCVNPGSLREGSLALATLEDGRIATEFVTVPLS